MRVVWQVEKDEYCRRVLAKHWPEVERFEDVKDVGAHNLKPVDLICGGFPCQDISYAGKGAGLSGERSGLWYEFARIVREMEPRIVVVENVAALLTRGLDQVLGTLASIGYDAEWDCVSASDVGAPHQRERVFIVAHAPCEQSPGHKQTSADSDCSDRLSLKSRGGNRPRPATPHWETEPDVGRVVDGLSSEMVIPPLRALGNSVVPQVSEFIGRLIVEADNEMQKVSA